MKPKTLICIMAALIIVLFYYSVAKPIYANYTFAQFLQKREYESYNEYLSIARKNLAFEQEMVTYQMADFAIGFLNSNADALFTFKLANETLASLKKLQLRAIENYLTSLKLAQLLIVMSARDKQYLPQAEEAVQRCMAITPEHPYNDMLRHELGRQDVKK